MHRWHRAILFTLLFAFFTVTTPSLRADTQRKPNILFILADDLGYGDVGCYGQKKIKTPHIDKLARQGMRFTQAYAGSTVCAPSRCALMTGKHTGHCRVRGNALVPLQPQDVTVAEMLKAAGYITALIGKWGLGEPGSAGVPTRQGFDYFFGYLNQHHAHNYYPDYLWRNEKKVSLANEVPKDSNVATKKAVYSADLFTQEALKFIRQNKDQPFFLYLAYTLPHANNEAGRNGGNGMEVPSDEPYSQEAWPQPQKSHAAMITRLDRDIGQVLALLQELDLADNTIVFFSSDNGPHREGGANPDFFRSSGGLRGIKRSMHEGGVRVPLIVRWPDHIKAGSTSNHICAFWDFMPTAADLAGARAPENGDGISFAPTLLGQDEKQKDHDFLYWEFHEGGFHQGVRLGDWKAVRHNLKKIELYNLKEDPQEKNNVAAEHPDIVARIETNLREARTESKDWPIRISQGKKKK